MVVLHHVMQRGYFNPRSREGSDWTPPRPSAPQDYFNPRSREGSDILPGNSCCVMSFQSTLPRRERRGGTFDRDRNRDFNPRSREGSDADYVRKLEITYNISIHAPAKGATSISGA